MYYVNKIHLIFVLYVSFVFAEQESHLKTVIHKALAAKARQCMRNVNATEADLEYLRNEPPFPEKSSCIITCLLEKINIVQDNKFSKKGFIMIISPLLLTNTKKLDHMKSVAENCDNEINHDEVSKCQLGNEITTCVYKYAPELHFKS
ncbi:uncharacterized protein LOC123717832 [Pieris brassicae]|uniref:Uncharacterized protein n=1 Tax=Pieris brassicae TaxID=7116 RepID=A0A9P0TK52_PIEBR|nr:uncharacterized protein LOC123717832 [Pieris brassicae]CAH4033719.1 unnamed protein product [Pieris brassicae]